MSSSSPEHLDTSHQVKWWIVGITAVSCALIVAAYAYSNWKGQRDLDRFGAHLRKLGYQTDLQVIYKRDLPDEENIFKHPAIQKELALPATAWVFNTIDTKLKKIAPDYRRNLTNTTFTKSTDLTKWKYGVPGATPAEIAKGLLHDLDPELQRMRELREAFARPRSEMNITWRDLNGVKIPDPFPLLASIRLGRAEALIMQLQAFAANREDVMISITTQLALLRTIRHEPGNLLNEVCHSAVLRELVVALKEVTSSGTMTENDYQTVEKELAAIDLHEELRKSLIGEILWATNFDRIDSYATPICLTDGWKFDKETIFYRSLGVLRNSRPVGSSASKNVQAYETVLSRLAATSDKLTRRVTWEDFRFFNQLASKGQTAWVVNSWGGLNLEKDADTMIWGHIAKAITRTLSCESNLALLRTNIALERYRLKSGSYPPSLDALVPGFLPAVLQDSCDLQPLR